MSNLATTNNGIVALDDWDDRMNGTSLKGYVQASYSDLTRLLGEPLEGDGYKVSSEWFVEWDGNVYTIYDWKMTDLYDDNTLSVDEFRSWSSYEWHIGAHVTNVRPFAAALIRAIANMPKELTAVA